ncbi:hypothetical protein GOB57_10260 [Sinorhizobium meliloti]|nr:hypothetical protein [Sinorhizobium meliloti]
MSQSQKPPVSEVIGNTESFIHRVIDIRRRAAELSEQAARLQEEAYLAAVRDLGTEDGPMAFALACRGLGVDPKLRSGHAPARIDVAESAPPAVAIAPSTAPVVAAPAAPAVRAPAEPPRQTVTSAPGPQVTPAAAQSPAPPAEPVQATAQAPHKTTASSDHDDPSRLVRYGVTVKRSKLSEAEEVIDQARRTAAQNRKSNPYSEDRGRNAWRNTLFAAVLAAESGNAGQVEHPARGAATIPLENTGPSVAIAESEIHDSDAAAPEISPLEEAFPYLSPEARTEGDNDDPTGDGDAVAIVGMSEEDVLEDGAPVAEPTASQSPVLPSRAVTFTDNPVQAAPQPQPEGRTPTQPPLSRQPSPFTRAVPDPASSTPEVHVDRPVQNRTFAHGQAVPMPKGLKEAIKRIDDEQPSTPTITPPPLRKAPSFIPRYNSEDKP